MSSRSTRSQFLLGTEEALLVFYLLTGFSGQRNRSVARLESQALLTFALDIEQLTS